MISSIDRITVAAKDLLSAKKTFDCFFDTSPSYEVIEENLGYKSLIYNFENIQFELLSTLDTKSNNELENFFNKNNIGGLYGFSLRAENKEFLDKALISPPINVKESIGNESLNFISGNLNQSENFKLSLNYYDAPLSRSKYISDLFALDHLVVTTNDGDKIVNLYKEKLGVRLALDQLVEEWGGRMLFFRTGHSTIEVIDNKAPGEDVFWGLAWKTKDIESTCERLSQNNINVSEVRKGRKKDTLVATVKFDEIKIPTLLVEHLNRA